MDITEQTNKLYAWYDSLEDDKPLNKPIYTLLSSCGYGESRYNYYRCETPNDIWLVRYTGIDLEKTLNRLFDRVIFRSVETLPEYRLYDLNTVLFD